jgi:hypothetical protein
MKAIFEFFAYEMGPLGPVLLVLLAVGSMWFGYRFSRPSKSQQSLRRLEPPAESSRERWDSSRQVRVAEPHEYVIVPRTGQRPAFAKRRCPECTGDNDFLEFRESILLPGGFGDFVPQSRLYAHYFRCRRCGYDLRLETASFHPDSNRQDNLY